MIYIIVITGTNFDNINRQFSSLITGNHKQNLYICTNRGSEVYGFNKKSEPVLLYRFTATKKENHLLDKIVEKTGKEIKNISKVKLEIIYNRLNRRRLDLIPEWKDPQKDEIDKLLTETQNKLEKGGFSGGIRKAFKLMENTAKTSGLAKARITSDVKHLEVGLTDKSDSMQWIIDNIARKNNIPNNEILVDGDEFGKIGGFEGSDSKMILKNQSGITYFSVGIEPNGVPDPVIYTGGGPKRFLEILSL